MKIGPDWTLKGDVAVHSPGNTLLRIDAVWLAVSVDANGNEGMCAVSMDFGAGPMLMPLMAADEKRLQTLVIPKAKELAEQTNAEIRVIRIGGPGSRITVASFSSRSQDAQDAKK
jgi:hypothetical protein